MCKVLTVTRSSYYDWEQKIKTLPHDEFRLRQRMKALFKKSRQSLGSRSLVKNLRREGFTIGRYKVRRLMKELNLQVKTKKKFKVTTHSQHNYPVARNLLDRQFNPLRPNQAWGTDITYVWTCEGWVYLAVVIDLYSRRVIGWCIDSRQTQSLVIRALMMAIALRKPAPGLIHHSDRGSQYASHKYQNLLSQHGIVASMSRKGNCWDNSPIERFFSSLKREWLGDILYQTRRDAITDIREYVAIYYNSNRLHSTLDYQTPMEFENNLEMVSEIA